MISHKIIISLVFIFCVSGTWAGPLHDAVEVGNLAKVRQLVASKSVDINKIDRRGIWPLLAATSDGNVAMVKLLLVLKADVNLTDQYNYSALHEAATLGFDEVIEILVLANATMNLRDVNSITPLGYAMRSQSMEAVEVLQNLGATQ